MRNPVRGEADAFYIAFGAAALIGVSAVLGALVDPLAGVALFVVGVIAALVWDTRTKDPDRRRALREAAAQAPDGSGRARVLVIANRTMLLEPLRSEMLARGAAGASLHLVAPILASRSHYIASDIDSELRDARTRIDDALAWARTQGIELTGRVGDPNAALSAIEDELRISGADEVIVSTLPPGQSNWLETGIVERLREELEIPVTHLVAENEPSPAQAGG